jgi:FkbM family methyltransferase
MSPFAKVRILLEASRTVGLRTAWLYYLNWFRCSLGRPGSATLQLQPKGARYPVTLRGGTSADTAVFRQIFIEQEYQPLYKTPAVKSILDLGANIGLSAVVLLNRFPAAEVVAVEPDPENYRACSQNLAPYGSRARVILGAVWSRPGKLALTRVGDCREWAVTVIEPRADSPGVVQSWDTETLFAMAGFETVDLLKIDIERSELEIFKSDSAAWIPRVRNLCIELHGRDCEEVFFRAMSSFEYELERSGELVICRNIRPRRNQEGI